MLINGCINYKHESIKMREKALASVDQWIECWSANQKVGSIPLRVHAWVVSQVPSCGYARGNQSMFLSHMDGCISFSPSLPLSLKINK